MNLTKYIEHKETKNQIIKIKHNLSIEQRQPIISHTCQNNLWNFYKKRNSDFS